jgi:plastocyanin
MRLRADRNRDALHVARRRCALQGLLIVWMCAPAGVRASAELTVALQSADRHAVSGAVVTATPLDAVPRGPAPKKTAVMDQVNKAFLPQVLVVEAGTVIEFPNSDTVSHQVYSFSPAKRFQLSLYKGEVHAPIQFDQPGLVVLGCNIHDSMVGYIYVADTPYFGKTSSAGELRFENLPPGRYRIQVWSPVIADDSVLLSRDVAQPDDLSTRVEFRLAKPMRALPEPHPHPNGWDSY